VIREARREPCVTDCVERRTNIREVVEYLIDYLLSLQRERERRQKNVRIRGRGHHDGPANVSFSSTLRRADIM
jgi:hypothetical protein